MKLCTTCNTLQEISEFHRKMNRCKTCSRKASLGTYHKKYKGTTERKHYAKVMSIKRRLGISPEEYESLSLNQATCAICDKVFEDSFDKQLDHCHETGKIRKFLCHKCNKALGLMNDNPTLLEKAAEYLKENK